MTTLGTIAKIYNIVIKNRTVWLGEIIEIVKILKERVGRSFKKNWQLIKNENESSFRRNVWIWWKATR